MKRGNIVRTSLGDIGELSHKCVETKPYDWWVAFHVPGIKDKILEPYRESELTVILTLQNVLEEAIPWSKKVFGEGQRVEGLCKHIEKELEEIRKKPDDISEWIDVIILALDGAWRQGYTPDEIFEALVAKYKKNYQREWPAPVSQDEPIMHKKGTHD